jgi:hypothetical protein
MWIDIKPGLITETEIALPVIDESTLKHLGGQHDQSTHGSWAGYNSDTATKYFGAERARALKKVEGQGPSISELNTVFNATSSGEADVALSKIRNKVEELYKTNIKGSDGMLYKTEIDEVSTVGPSYGTDGKLRYGIYVEGTINSFTGEYAGFFRRALATKNASGAIEVDHTVLKLEPEFQEKGVGSDFYMNTENKYIVNGYEKIRVHAGLEQGGYVWAKAGFSYDDGSVLDEVDRKENISNVKSHWESSKYKLNSKAGYDYANEEKRYDAVIQRFETGKSNVNKIPSLYELANYKLLDGTRIGKDIMQSSTWYGVKYLTPSGQKGNV